MNNCQIPFYIFSKIRPQASILKWQDKKSREKYEKNENNDDDRINESFWVKSYYIPLKAFCGYFVSQEKRTRDFAM